MILELFFIGMTVCAIGTPSWLTPTIDLEILPALYRFVDSRFIFPISQISDYAFVIQRFFFRFRPGQNDGILVIACKRINKKYRLM